VDLRLLRHEFAQSDPQCHWSKWGEVVVVVVVQAQGPAQVIAP
jgi:hypothetical protein